MKKRLLVTILGCLTIILLGSMAAAQPPVNLGRLCFQASPASSCAMLYNIQFTWMGNIHFALTGLVQDLADDCAAFPAIFQPVHGAAQLNGDTVEMTLHKADYAPPGVVTSPSYMKAFTITALVDAEAGTGEFHELMHRYNITTELEETFYDTGTFNVILCP